LEAVVKCQPETIGLLVCLLERLGPLVDHPGLMKPHSIDSIGKYLDETRFDEMRTCLASGNGVSLVYKVRKFDVIACDAADKLPSAQRRQCVAVRGTHEVARRLEAGERGIAEVVAAFPGGATLAVRQNRNAHRLVVICTKADKKDKKILDALLGPDDAPWLEHFFEEAARGQRQAAAGPSAATRLVKLEKGDAFWELPAWYAEKVAQLAQEVFRLHAFVSAISQDVSRALFVDRVTAHRLERGPPEDHRTLIKGALHRASGGCACLLHKSAAPTARFVRLEFRMEFCGCTLVNGRCPTHSLAEHTPQSAKFPGVCMLGLKVELRCAHDQGASGAHGGVRLPLDVRDNKMRVVFALPFVVDVASCGACLTRPDPPCADMQLDMDAAFAELNDLRLQHAHVGDQILQRDVIAVHLLRKRSRLHKSGRFAGRVSAECSAILKTHKHLFKTNVS